MTGFKTKAGKALAAAFDPSHRDKITNPEASNKINKGDDGEPLPIDRTASGVIYQGDQDEAQVKE